jgi:hypothetical protein
MIHNVSNAARGGAALLVIRWPAREDLAVDPTRRRPSRLLERIHVWLAAHLGNMEQTFG